LFRLYDATSGTIRVDGVDLMQSRIETVRQRIGLVTQDVQLFHGTVRDNITFFNRDIPDHRIHAVIDQLGIASWVNGLRQGLDTPLEAAGSGLSAGESQLLAFVRVFLKNPGLVILDESQYLADPERGVVWEETIIFCPSQARLLLLSASIGNPHDIADWLTSIRSTACHLIKHSKRSVPLRAGYLHPDGKLTPLFRTIGIPHGHPGHWHPEAKRLFARYEDETMPSGRRR